MPPVRAVDHTGFDLWAMDRVGYRGLGDFEPSHRGREQAGLLPSATIVDPESDPAAALRARDIGSSRAGDADTAVVAGIDEQHAGIARIQYAQPVGRPRVAPRVDNHDRLTDSVPALILPRALPQAPSSVARSG